MATDLNIVNLVASARYTDSLDIIAVAEDLDIDYEPEQFPGMVYRNTNPKVCVLLFRSGKAVATGAKSYDQAKVVNWTHSITHYGLTRMILSCRIL